MKKVFLFLFFVCSTAWGSCWDGLVSGQYGKILDCSFSDWKHSPDDQRLRILLDSLAYVYFTDGTNESMKKFFEAIRSHDLSATSAFSLEAKLINHYSSFFPPTPETAASGVMPQHDALVLFVLSQADPETLPAGLTSAMYISIYQQVEILFVLGRARDQQFSILPKSEYSRMLEIVRRMSWMPDPYLKAVNHYFQGVLLLNLGGMGEGQSWIQRSRQEFITCLANVKEQVSQKRILLHLADANLVLKEYDDAEQAYISVLKMDPQDWDALMALSKLLYGNGKCTEPGVWIEASIKSSQALYEIVIHCGNREWPEEELEPDNGAPLIALWDYGRNSGRVLLACTYSAIAGNSKSY